MASADRIHAGAAAIAALRMTDKLQPNARLWLAMASLNCDPKGRTRYSAKAYADDTQDTITNGNLAIRWLTSRGIVLHDYDEDGQPCLRLIHHDWAKDYTTIGGYSRDAGQKRDGHPPQYGRTVDDVIEPNGQPHNPPSDVHWSRLVTEESA